MTLDEIIQKINATPDTEGTFAFEEGLLDALGSHLGVLAPRGVQDAIQRLVAEVDGPRLRVANQVLSHNAAFTDAMQRLSAWRITNASASEK